MRRKLRIADKKIFLQNNICPSIHRHSSYTNEPLNLKIHKNQKLKITHWNINGFRAIIEKKDFSDYLTSNDFDIICLSELKYDKENLKRSENNENKLWYNKYNQYWYFSTSKKGYSGCSIFSKYKPLTKKFGIDDETFDDEGRVITLEFELFFLVNVYVPNSGEKLQRLEERINLFDKKFQIYIESLKSKKTVLIMGDFNVAHQEIDLTNPKTNKRTHGFTQEERDSFSNFLNLGYKDCWREFNPGVVKYSWWSFRSKEPERKDKPGWRVDYCLINNEAFGLIESIEMRNDVLGSDHCPIEVVINFHQNNEKIKEKSQKIKKTKEKGNNNNSFEKNLTDEKNKNKILIENEDKKSLKKAPEKKSKSTLNKKKKSDSLSMKKKQSKLNSSSSSIKKKISKSISNKKNKKKESK